MSGLSEYEQEIIGAYPRLLVENYCIIASSALLWFDFALTFPDEYRRIWNRKFTGATLIYLMMRYVAVIERIFFVLEVLVWKSSDRTCGGITHTDDVLLFINYLSVSAFTTLRVYGVWGRDWKPLLVVLPLSLVKPIVVMYENAHYIPLQAGPPFGCTYLYLLPDPVLSNISITAKAATIAADSILIALTWIKTFGISKDSRKIGMNTPLTTLLLRDGTAYFLILLIIQIITIVSNKIGNSLTIWLVWPYFDQVITVIFLSRFMLDLRGIYFAGHGGREADTTLHLSDVRFQGISSTIVGNLGATLTTTLSITVPAPSSGPSTAAEASPSDSLDSLGGAYAWEWRDETEYSVDPFRAGLKEAEAEAEMEKPPALVVEEVEMSEVEKESEGGDGIQEEARTIGHLSPV